MQAVIGPWLTLSMKCSEVELQADEDETKKRWLDCMDWFRHYSHLRHAEFSLGSVCLLETVATQSQTCVAYNGLNSPVI